MTKTLAIIAALSLALAAGSADAASKCRDAKGKFIKCPPAAAAPAATTPTTTTTTTRKSSMASTTTKRCVKGKACGNTCISVKDVCHK